MSALIRRVSLRSYKSIGNCKLDLGDLCLFVGPNGSGKSNIVDALSLVSESLSSTLEYAIRQRGGIGEVRRRSSGHPTHFAISLRMDLGGGRNAVFAFEIGALPNGGFRVQREVAHISTNDQRAASFYETRDGELVAASDELKSLPKIESDRLTLASISGVSTFRPMYDALTSMGFYNINPAEVRKLQPHDQGEMLKRDGSNLAAVVKRMANMHEALVRRVEEYLRQIVPGIEGFEYKALGPSETLEFRQRVKGGAHPWKFYAAAMSDGTLRSLGVLVALFQSRPDELGFSPLIGIEEPESSVHPAAARVLMDALLEASTSKQVIATTHSPDLLDHEGLKAASLFAVRNVEGETIVAPADAASKSAIQRELFTAGELLRQNQLEPDPALARHKVSQGDLFRIPPK